MGEALEPMRDGVVIATTFGFTDAVPTKGLDCRPERIRVWSRGKPRGGE